MAQWTRRHLSHSKRCPAEQQQISNVMFVVCGSCERVPLLTPSFGTQTTWKPETTQGLEVFSPTFVTWLLFFVFSYFVFSFGAAVSLSFLSLFLPPPRRSCCLARFVCWVVSQQDNRKLPAPFSLRMVEGCSLGEERAHQYMRVGHFFCIHVKLD